MSSSFTGPRNIYLSMFQTIEKATFRKAVWAILLGTSKVVRKERFGSVRFPRITICMILCVVSETHYYLHPLGYRKAERDGPCSKIGAFVL